MPFPLLIPIAIGAAVLYGGAVLLFYRRELTQARPTLTKARPELSSTPGGPADGGGIKVWAENSPDITRDADAGTWWPDYVRSLGCKTFHYGVCWRTLTDDLAEYDGQKWAGTAHEIGESVANIWSIGDWGLGDVSTWLMGLMCIRMEWALHKYEWRMDINDPSGGDQQITMWKVDRKDGDLFAPPNPLPPKYGWDRVWVNEPRNPTRLPSRTRSPFALLVYFPTERVTIELATQTDMRRMLRMQAEGALSPDNLDKVACGKTRKYIARRSKAMEHYK